MAFDPLSLLILLLIGAGGAAIITVAFLAFTRVREYLRNKKAQKTIREDALIMKRKLSSGKVRVIAGFLDGESDIKEPQIWEAEEVDSFIEGINDDEVVIVR